jgi:GTP-binding protein HflX
VLTDTVGFIQKLPTTLVEAFKSTLDEIATADLILHVVDASAPQREAQAKAVLEVLEQIGAHEIPQLTVYNKLDLLEIDEAEALETRYPQALLVSAQTGAGIDALLARIEQTANATSQLLSVLIPFTQGSLVQLAHERCSVRSEEYTGEGTLLQVQVPQTLFSRFAPYLSS